MEEDKKVKCRICRLEMREVGSTGQDIMESFGGNDIVKGFSSVRKQKLYQCLNCKDVEII